MIASPPLVLPEEPSDLAELETRVRAWGQAEKSAPIGGDQELSATYCGGDRGLKAVEDTLRPEGVGVVRA